MESSCHIKHKSRLAAQVQHLVTTIGNMYVRSQTAGMRSLGCTAVDDVDSFSARAKALRVLGQADEAQDFFDDASADRLVLQALAEGVQAGEVLVVFVRLLAEHSAAKAAAPVGMIGIIVDIGTVEAAAVGEAEVCIDNRGTFFGELDDA